MTCIACQTEKKPIYKYEKWNCKIVGCPECGLGKALVLENFDPKTYYNNDYFQGGHKDGYSDYKGSEKILKKEFNKSVQEIKQYIKSGTLLEIGCAYGYFLDSATKYFSSTGLDISYDAITECRKRGLDAFNSNLNEMNYKDQTFDVVTLFDCIEHLDSPESVLKEISRVTRAGGLLMLTTGNWGSPIARFTGKNWRLMTPPQHLFYFTKLSIKKFLDKHEFDVIKISHPWKLVPVSLALYQVLNRIGIKIKLPRFLSKIFFPINLFDAFKVIAIKRNTSQPL